MLSSDARDRLLDFAFSLAATRAGTAALAAPVDLLHRAVRATSWTLARGLRRLAWRAMTVDQARAPTLAEVVAHAVLFGSDDEVPEPLAAIRAKLCDACADAGRVDDAPPWPLSPCRASTRAVDLRAWVDETIDAVPRDARDVFLDAVDGAKAALPLVLARHVASLHAVDGGPSVESVLAGRFTLPRALASCPLHVFQKLVALAVIARAGATLSSWVDASPTPLTPRALVSEAREEKLAAGLRVFSRSLADLVDDATDDASRERPLDDLARGHAVHFDVSHDGTVRFALAPGRPTYVQLTPSVTGYALARGASALDDARDDASLRAFCTALALHLLLDPHGAVRAALDARYGKSPAERLLRDLERARARSLAKAKTRSVDDEGIAFVVTLAHDVVSIDTRAGVRFSLEAWTTDAAGRPKKRVRASTLLARGATSFADDRDVLALLAGDERDVRPPLRALFALIARWRRDEAPSVWVTRLGDARGPLRARVSVARPTLHVDERGGGLAFVVRLGARDVPLAELSDGGEGFFIFEDGVEGTTLHVVEGSRALALLGDTFAAHPSVVTAAPDERVALVSLVCDIAADALFVTLDDALAGARVPASATVVAELSRRASGGMRVRLGHRPLPSSRLLAPDEGPDAIPGARDGARVVAERDRVAERARLVETAAAIGLDDADLDEPLTYVIESLERALPIVERAHERSLARSPSNEPVLVVEWAAGSARMAVAAHADLRALRLSLGETGRWLSLEGALVVDERRIPLVDVLRALRRGARYVPLDDERFVRIEDQLRAELEHLSVTAHARGTALMTGASSAARIDALAVGGAEVEGRARLAALVERARAAESLVVRAPPGLEATLRPYQLEGFAWLMRLAALGTGGVLADEMGLGKTLQAIAALVARASRGPAVVVAPTSVVPNWARELARFAPSLRAVVYGGSARERTLDELAAGDVLLVSYALLARDEALARVAFETAVFDEAQALKNHDTVRARRAAALSRTWSIALTGTPVENRVGELWSIFHLVAPELFGPFDAFARDVIAPIEQEGSATVRRALARAIRPFVLRRRKRDVALELPAKTEIVVVAEPSEEEAAHYEGTRRAAVKMLEEARAHPSRGDARFRVLELLTLLRLLACHPRLVDDRSTIPSAKHTRVMAVLDELVAAARRALVFSQFTRHLDLVAESLSARGVTFLRLDGSTPAEKRIELVDAFQRGEANVFLISLKAGGTGLNLTAADDVLHLDPWWNPAVEDQATDRAHRLGQEKPVTVTRFVTRGTIEEKIVRLHSEKRALVDELLAGSDGGRGLGLDELVALVSDVESLPTTTAARTRRRARDAT